MINKIKEILDGNDLEVFYYTGSRKYRIAINRGILRKTMLNVFSYGVPPGFSKNFQNT